VDIETAASDPTSNPVATPTEWYFLEDQNPVANVATINSNVTIYSNGFKVDTSKIASGICLQGGTWDKPDIRRYNNTAAVLLQNATVSGKIYTPLQDGAVVGCTGNLNAVTTLNGDATGLTGADNKFVVNVAGVPGAYEIIDSAQYFDGVSDFAEVPNTLDSNDFSVNFNATLDSNIFQQEFVECRNGGISGFVFRSFEVGNLNYDTWGSSGFDRFSITKPEGNYDISLEYDNGVKAFSVDEILVTSSINVADFSSLPNIKLGCGSNKFGQMILSKVELSSGYKYIAGTEWETSTLVSVPAGSNGTISSSTPVLYGELTPKIGGSLLITSGPNAGLYAGGTQPPSESDEHYGYEYSYEY
jgi:hypothetical protein